MPYRREAISETTGVIFTGHLRVADLSVRMRKQTFVTLCFCSSCYLQCNLKLEVGWHIFEGDTYVSGHLKNNVCGLLSVLLLSTTNQIFIHFREQLIGNWAVPRLLQSQWHNPWNNHINLFWWPLKDSLFHLNRIFSMPESNMQTKLF